MYIISLIVLHSFTLDWPLKYHPHLLKRPNHSIHHYINTMQMRFIKKKKVYDLPGSSLTTLIAAMTEVLMLRAYKDKETKLLLYADEFNVIVLLHISNACWHQTFASVSFRQISSWFFCKVACVKPPWQLLCHVTFKLLHVFLWLQWIIKSQCTKNHKYLIRSKIHTTSLTFD